MYPDNFLWWLKYEYQLVSAWENNQKYQPVSIKGLTTVSRDDKNIWRFVVYNISALSGGIQIKLNSHLKRSMNTFVV